MEYAYATCLLNETGAEINEHNLIAVLESAGGTVQESRVKAIVAALEDIDVDDVTEVAIADETALPESSVDEEVPPGPLEDGNVDAQFTTVDDGGDVLSNTEGDASDSHVSVQAADDASGSAKTDQSSGTSDPEE